MSSPTMHGDEQKWVDDAIRTNWVSTVGANIDEIEKRLADYVGVKFAVALSSGTTALHLATKLAAEKLYGRACPNIGSLLGRKAFCSDITFNASVNPIAYEGGEAVFIDTERDTWNMSPHALKKAFELFPDVKLVVIAHLYGTPGKMEELKAICDKHDALIVEDAAESLGAKYKFRGRWGGTGSFGDCGCVSFNGNKIVTGSCGGMFFTDSREDANKVRKWSTQSREDAPWYQHEEIGSNYLISNLVAGVVRGKLQYLDGHLAQKKAIWKRYEKGFADLPVKMNPWDRKKSAPNFWLSCITIDEDAMAPQERGERDYKYQSERGKSSPQEILEALSAFNVEGRPIWKPMHLQPIHASHAFVAVRDGQDVGADL
ncbi:MAG: DegT/DnrJ/EryC1/StrS family aminotransferase, partial [Thermoguttaceae bacterium]|nr:DegT/DnrJ/EryC1/StrS family aminotransferase [Thermoguttaceae bacterium]